MQKKKAVLHKILYYATLPNKILLFKNIFNWSEKKLTTILKTSKDLTIPSDEQYCYKQNQTLSLTTRIWPTNNLKNGAP